MVVFKKKFTQFRMPILAFGLMVLLFAFQGCFNIKPIEIKQVNSISVQEGSITKGVLIKVMLTLHNPNVFKLYVGNTDIDVFVEGVNFGKLIVPQNITMGSKDDFTGKFSLEVGLKQLLMVGGSILPKIKTGEVELGLKGTIEAKAMSVSNTYDINYKQQVSLKK